LLVLCIVLWIGIVSFRHVEYSHDLWWQFALHADAPRMLRASLAAGVTALGLALWKLMRSGQPVPLDVDPADLEHVRQIIRTCSDSSANVALLGDKRFLWSDDRQAFIMYQVSGNSWVALGDPVGPPPAQQGLAWAFREIVDRHDGRPVYYQISDESLALYVDMGLSLAKIGEDARVSLQDFSLQGSRRAEFRQAINRANKHGASFEVVPSEKVKAVAAKLRGVSDSWLEDKSAAEKGFSLGSFSEEYISNFDCAIVRVDNEIVAFANLWAAPAAGEVSVDLMRHNNMAHKGVMDYLFTELMLWAKTQGYAWFSLGMAPLSGLEQRSLAPLWHKIGHLIFSHGESFYNFEGLRKYKEKFDPEWRPRYIACPGGLLALPRALLDTSRLISGGVSKIMTK
jgi:phosphatidylglycerol lysyltransferase